MTSITLKECSKTLDLTSNTSTSACAEFTRTVPLLPPSHPGRETRHMRYQKRAKRSYSATDAPGILPKPGKPQFWAFQNLLDHLVDVRTREARPASKGRGFRRVRRPVRRSRHAKRNTRAHAFTQKSHRTSGRGSRRVRNMHPGCLACPHARSGPCTTRTLGAWHSSMRSVRKKGGKEGAQRVPMVTAGQSAPESIPFRHEEQVAGPLLR